MLAMPMGRRCEAVTISKGYSGPGLVWHQQSPSLGSDWLGSDVHADASSSVHPVLPLQNKLRGGPGTFGLLC
ncbi:hypothetical protein E4U42_007672 [Claviceps africana]|uniref:Uncharacterized protein n=1 Tax=Claviceps africana TaxID=83212 RepID=A0A8K0J0W2_9HYPO|nr:hypothetical protein E4U42_007672 [Claviceps africana]